MSLTPFDFRMGADLTRPPWMTGGSLRLVPDVSSVRNRTNDSRWVPSNKSIRGNVLGNHGTRRNNRVFAYRHSANDRCAGSDPDVSLSHDGVCDYAGAPLGWFNGVSRHDEAHVRTDHHIVGDVESAKVIESAVLIYEDVASHADIDSAGCVERWYQYKTVVHLLADEIAELGPDFICIAVRQTIERGRDGHRSFDVS